MLYFNISQPYMDLWNGLPARHQFFKFHLASQFPTYPDLLLIFHSSNRISNQFGGFNITGENIIYGWGANSQGIFGVNQTVLESLPVPTALTAFSPDLVGKIKKFVMGSTSALVLTKDSEIWEWGVPRIDGNIIPPPRLDLSSLPLGHSILDATTVIGGGALITDFHKVCMGSVSKAMMGLNSTMKVINSAPQQVQLDLPASTNTTFYRYNPNYVVDTVYANTILLTAQRTLINDTGCPPPAPNAGFVCIGGVWIISYNTGGPNITLPIPGTTVIIGNLSIPTTGTIIFRPTFDGNPGPILKVNGCAFIEGNVTVQISQEDFDFLLKSKNPRLLNLIESECPDYFGNLTFVADSTANQECRRVQLEGASKTGSKSSLSVLMSVDASGCKPIYGGSYLYQSLLPCWSQKL